MLNIWYSPMTFWISRESFDIKPVMSLRQFSVSASVSSESKQSVLIFLLE